MKEKKLNALDILDQNRLPSPKDLKYLCMLKIVNGAYLYINEGRQWEGERIHALVSKVNARIYILFYYWSSLLFFSLHFIDTLAKQKNISKVESDIAAARVEESSSRDMLKECMDKQEKVSRLLTVNEDVRTFSFIHVVFVSLIFLHTRICCCLSKSVYLKE